MYHQRNNEDSYYLRLPHGRQLGEKQALLRTTITERDPMGGYLETVRADNSRDSIYNSGHTTTPNLYAFKPYPDINTTNPAFQKYHQIDFTTGRDLTYVNMLADMKAQFLYNEPPTTEELDMYYSRGGGTLQQQGLLQDVPYYHNTNSGNVTTPYSYPNYYDTGTHHQLTAPGVSGGTPYPPQYGANASQRYSNSPVRTPYSNSPMPNVSRRYSVDPNNPNAPARFSTPTVIPRRYSMEDNRNTSFNGPMFLPPPIPQVMYNSFSDGVQAALRMLPNLNHTRIARYSA